MSRPIWKEFVEGNGAGVGDGAEAGAGAGAGDMAIMHALVEHASELGAQRALAHLGLDDAAATRDMAELRELLSAWRDAKKSARAAAIGWVVKMALALLLIGLAVKLGLTALILK